MLWLHGFRYHRQDAVGEGFKVHILPQAFGKRFQCLFGVVFLTVEAPVYDSLHAGAQWRGDGYDRQRREHQGELAPGGEIMQQQAGSKYKEQVQRSQDKGKEGIDQGAPDDQVDIPQAIAQDCQPDGYREDQQERQEQGGVPWDREVEDLGHGEPDHQGCECHQATP